MDKLIRFRTSYQTTKRYRRSLDVKEFWDGFKLIIITFRVFRGDKKTRVAIQESSWQALICSFAESMRKCQWMGYFVVNKRDGFLIAYLPWFFISAEWQTFIREGEKKITLKNHASSILNELRIVHCLWKKTFYIKMVVSFKFIYIYFIQSTNIICNEKPQNVKEVRWHEK